MYALAVRLLISSLLVMKLVDIILLLSFQIDSIGFRLGEYGGRNMGCMLSISAYSTVSDAWCARKLSRVRTILLSGFDSLIVSMNRHTSSFLLSS